MSCDDVGTGMPRLVVQNTFIRVLDDGEDDEPLFRSSTYPYDQCGRSGSSTADPLPHPSEDQRQLTMRTKSTPRADAVEKASMHDSAAETFSILKRSSSGAHRSYSDLETRCCSNIGSGDEFGSPRTTKDADMQSIPRPLDLSRLEIAPRPCVLAADAQLEPAPVILLPPNQVNFLPIAVVSAAADVQSLAVPVQPVALIPADPIIGLVENGPHPPMLGAVQLVQLQPQVEPFRVLKYSGNDLASWWRGSGEYVGLSAPQRVMQPEFGTQHRFHAEATKTGRLSADQRVFTKDSFAGRLSVLTEDEVHTQGCVRYCLQFASGDLSSADGVGFIFSNKLPCVKNIQLISSVFANSSGRICIRTHSEVIRSNVCVRPLQIGDWVSVTIDLDNCTAEFEVWPNETGASSRASIHFGRAFGELQATSRRPVVRNGYFACVVKNVGVTVRLGS